MMSMAIGGVWGPSVLAKYSKFDIQGMDEIVGTGVKLMGFVLALTVGLLCGLAGPFLDIWLGSDFQSLTWVLVIMLFPLATNLIVTPFFYIHVSFNKLKIPALVELGLGLSNLFLAICLTPQYKTMGLVLAGGLTLTLYFSIFAPVYAAKIMGLPWTHYLKRLGLITLSTLGVTLVAYFLNKTIPLTSYLHLIIGAGLISTGYLALVYFLGLSSTEKELMESFLSKETGNNQNGYNDPL